MVEFSIVVDTRNKKLPHQQQAIRLEHCQVHSTVKTLRKVIIKNLGRNLTPTWHYHLKHEWLTSTVPPVTLSSSLPNASSPLLYLTKSFTHHGWVGYRGIGWESCHPCGCDRQTLNVMQGVTTKLECSLPPLSYLSTTSSTPSQKTKAKSVGCRVGVVATHESKHRLVELSLSNCWIVSFMICLGMMSYWVPPPAWARRRKLTLVTWRKTFARWLMRQNGPISSSPYTFSCMIL